MTGLPAFPTTGRDLRWVVGGLLLTWFVVAVPVVDETGLRTAVVVPAAIALPGYALLSALVPAPESDSLLEGALGTCVFAAALGVATVLLLGIGLTLTPWGITTGSALLSISVVTLVGVFVATMRRPAAEHREPTQAADGSAETPGSTGTTARARARASPSVPDDRSVVRSVGLIVVVAGAIGIAGSAYLVGLHEQPGHVEFAATPAEGGTAGSIPPGAPIDVGLHHDRRSSATYTVVASVENADEATGETRDSRRIDQFSVAVEGNGTWSTRHVPPVPWQNETRAVYEVYRGAEATGSPDGRVHLWIGAGDDRVNGGETA